MIVARRNDLKTEGTIYFAAELRKHLFNVKGGNSGERAEDETVGSLVKYQLAMAVS